MLRKLRPSNLVILFALPFIVFLFATSPDYSRSLSAIVGVEPGAMALLPGFVLLLAAFGGALAALRWRGRWGWAAAALSLVAGLALASSELAMPFIASVLANAVDGFTSDWVVRGETPRRLTDAVLAVTTGTAHGALWTYWAANLVGFAGLYLAAVHPLRRWAVWGLLVLNGLGLGGIVLFAHLGFAAGVAITLRAAILAYGLAVLLGLGWIGLLQLQVARRTYPLFIAFVLICLVAAGWQFAQPRQDFVLVGNLSGKVAVTPGTPKGLIDAVRFGQFPAANGIELPVKTLLGADAAMAAMVAGPDVTAALVPLQYLPAGAKPLWQVQSLADDTVAAGTAFGLVGLVLALLTLGGVLHGRHPLSVGAEFIIDTIRGIPMLVIVLYVGLPLSGAVKDATGGFIDLPNLLRGILAMALAYSAYLAEIFRSGINAVPRGQLEAARSLGLSRWQTARHVIIPQAFRIIIPPLGNEFIAILKDTSLLSILSIRDITQRMREFQSASFLPFAPYNSAAIFYLLLTLVAASLIASIERKYHVKHH